jgi:hypothetical protein
MLLPSGVSEWRTPGLRSLMSMDLANSSLASLWTDLIAARVLVGFIDTKELRDATKQLKDWFEGRSQSGSNHCGVWRRSLALPIYPVLALGLLWYLDSLRSQPCYLAILKDLMAPQVGLEPSIPSISDSSYRWGKLAVGVKAILFSNLN